MCVASEQQEGHTGAAAAAAQLSEPTTQATAAPHTAPYSCAPAVEAETSGAEGAPTSVTASVASGTGHASSEVPQCAGSRPAAAEEEEEGSEPVEGAAAEVAQSAEENDVLSRRHAGVTSDSAAAATPSADAGALGEFPTGDSYAAAGRNELARGRRNVRRVYGKASAGFAAGADAPAGESPDAGATAGAGAAAAESRRGGVRGKQGVKSGAGKSSAGKPNSDTGKRLSVHDSCYKGHGNERRRRGRRGKPAASGAERPDAAEGEAERGPACTLAEGGRGGESSCDGAAAGDCVRRRASRKDRNDVQSSKRERRKEYQRMRACLKPGIVPLRTAVVSYPAGGFLGEERTTESAVCPRVPLSAGGLLPTAGGSPTPTGVRPGSAIDDAAVTGASDVKDGGAAEDGRERTAFGTAGAGSGCTGQIPAALAAAAMIAGAGDEEETWRGSSRRTAGAAGGRVGRFSAAERAAICAALRQYAVDNGLEGGTVEAAVEHLMTAQDVSNSSSEGRRKRGGRALRFAAIARWLPQRSCASIYFYVRRNLCAQIGAKKHGPWSSEEVQTLVKMESELRVTHYRSRFARIAAELNRTASSVYDKWKEIGPRFASLSRSDTSGQGPATHPASLTVALHSDAGRAAGGEVTGTPAGAAFPEEGIAEGSVRAAACTTEAYSTEASGTRSQAFEHAASASSAEEAEARQPNHHVTRQSCEVEGQEPLQEKQLSQQVDEETPTESGGGANGNEIEDSSGDRATACKGVTEEEGEEEEEAGRGKGSTVRDGRYDSRSSHNTVQATNTAVGESSSEGESPARTKPAQGEVKLDASSHEANRRGFDVAERRATVHVGERHPGEGEHANGETTWVKGIEKVEGAMSSGTCLERRARFGTPEQVLQLLQAVQEQTGECLPATGISWSSVQKQFFPHVSASQLRLCYTTKLVPKELAKRMGVPAAEPVLLRFVVRCLDSLLNANRTPQQIHEVQTEYMSGCSREGGQCEDLAPVRASAEPHRKDLRTSLTLLRGGEGVAPVCASERDEFGRVSQLQQGTLDELVIDNVCDVDWLEILPFCPTALPPFVFRRAVAALPPTKTSEGEQRPESMQLPQQVLLLKQRLQLEGSSTKAGRDAALLLRAALPREALARAVRHALRKRRWKDMRKQQQERRITAQSSRALREQHRRPEEGLQRHQPEEQRKDHENGEVSDDAAPASTRVDGSGGWSNASSQKLNDSGEDSDESGENPVERDKREEEEEAREEAIEHEMTEAEREEKWHREEKLLGKAALLAVLRRVGGKEMRRRRRRNRRCMRVKECSTGFKGVFPAASDVSRIRSPSFVTVQLESTHTTSCDTNRGAVSAQSSSEDMSSCREERHILARLEDVSKGSETSEQHEAGQEQEQSQREYNEATSRACSKEQHPQLSNLEQERVSSSLLQSEGTPTRRRHRQRARHDILMGEVPKEENWQDDNLRCSGEVLETTVNGQQQLREEEESTIEVANAGGDLEQRAGGLMPQTTGAAGEGWQHLDGEVCGPAEAVDQAPVTSMQKTAQSHIVPDQSNSIADPAAEDDVEENLSDEQCELVRGEEALVQGSNEAPLQQEGLGRTGATALSSGEENVDADTRKRREEKSKSFADASSQSVEEVPSLFVDHSVEGNEQLSLRDVPLMEHEVVAQAPQRGRKKERKKVKETEETVREGLHGNYFVERLTESEGADTQSLEASMLRDEAHAFERERKEKRKMKKQEICREGLHGDIRKELLADSEGANTQFVEVTVARDEGCDLERGRKKKRKKVKEAEAFSEGLHGDTPLELFAEGEGANTQTIETPVPRDETLDLYREGMEKRKKMKKKKKKTFKEGLLGEFVVERSTENERVNPQTIEATMPRGERRDPERERKKKRKKMKKEETFREGLHGDSRAEHFAETEGANLKTTEASVPRDETHAHERRQKKKRKKMNKDDLFSEGSAGDTSAELFADSVAANTETTGAPVPHDETPDLDQEATEKRKKTKKKKTLKEGLPGDVVEHLTENEGASTQTIQASMLRGEERDLERGRKKKRKKVKKAEAFKEGLHGDYYAERFTEE